MTTSVTSSSVAPDRDNDELGRAYLRSVLAGVSDDGGCVWVLLVLHGRCEVKLLI